MRRLAIAAALVAGPAAAQGVDQVAVAGPAAFLGLGFVIGLAHALDADHVAAVAALLDREGGTRSAMARGAAWGLGHTAALFVICSGVLLLGLTISPTAEAALELAVGLLIAALGVRVLWRLRRERIHLHVHEHGGLRHVHAHSHAGEGPHRASGHGHEHRARALAPTFGVGLVHGAAGSAGLLVLVVASADSVGQALGAFVLFGVGSLLGMTMLTAAAGRPLALVHRSGAAARTTLAFGIAGLAFWVGGSVAAESLAALVQAVPAGG